MSFLFDSIAGFLNTVSSAIPTFEFTRDIINDYNTILPYFQKINYIFPVSEALTVMTLFITVQVLLVTFYWLSRAINLIRGAG
jgi:hypothetical protein